jgi:STE24 endopeptidase
MRIWFLFALLLGLMASLGPAAAQATPAPAPATAVETHALPPIAAPAPFDPVKATDAYLSQVSGAARARSDAYFEGRYVFVLIDTLWIVGVCAFLLWSRVSAHIRDFAERRTRSRFWQATLYAGPFVLIATALIFPLALYEDFFRERAYGLMNQTFWSWFRDFLTTTGLNLVVGTVAITALYAAIRRWGASWWVGATILTVVYFTIGMVIAPVLIAPLYNTYTPMPESALKHDVLALAEANGIPATDVYVFDASRQSDRISANVSGFLGTTRISLNDNLLNKSTHDEVLAVLGHEMGHYVLDHALYGLVLNTLVALVGFLFVSFGFVVVAGFLGGNWDVRRVDDPAGFPLLVALSAIFLMVATPITNTITRTAEIQADMYGLNAARKPDAFATAILKLSLYRKLDPSPFEEFVFYDHPSGRTRIWEAMRWKAGHIGDLDIKDGPKSPQ